MKIEIIASDIDRLQKAIERKTLAQDEENSLFLLLAKKYDMVDTTRATLMEAMKLRLAETYLDERF